MCWNRAVRSKRLGGLGKNWDREDEGARMRNGTERVEDLISIKYLGTGILRREFNII